MDNSFILCLDTLGIIVCAIIAIGVILLRLNKKVRDYLKKTFGCRCFCWYIVSDNYLVYLWTIYDMVVGGNYSFSCNVLY